MGERTPDSLPKVPDSLRNIDWVVAYLGLSKDRVRHLTASGRIPSIKVGAGRSGSVRYRQSEIDAWLDGRRRGGEAS